MRSDNLWKKKIRLLWLHLLPLMPFARIHRAQIKTTNAHAAIFSVSKHNGGQTTAYTTKTSKQKKTSEEAS